jgi:hypothetical protein
MIIEESVGQSWTELIRTDAEYYAVPVERLLQLMAEANFVATLVHDVPFFQPVLSGGAG